MICCPPLLATCSETTLKQSSYGLLNNGWPGVIRGAVSATKEAQNHLAWGAEMFAAMSIYGSLVIEGTLPKELPAPIGESH
jgi:hypothetical protein